MATTKIKSEFYIYQQKYSDYCDKAIDWFIKSWKYPYGSDEWKLCRLKMKIYTKKGKEYLEKAKTILENAKI